jgi:flavin-dependent dehydrogenase
VSRARFTTSGAGEALWDAIVLGAGPAGALVARRLALAGASVLLVDKKAFPRPKVCGACLNQDALSLLSAEGLGTLACDRGGLPLTTLEVRLTGRIARFPLPAGRALLRETFDSALAAEAVVAGARFLPETLAIVADCASRAAFRSVHLDRHGEAWGARAKVVIVAAGLGQRALESVAAVKTRTSRKARLGAGCTLDAFPDEYGFDVIHMAVGREGYVGLVRVEPNRLNVGAAFDRALLAQAGTPALAAASILDQAGFPQIATLRDARWQGTVGLSQETRPVAIHRLMLIGDAAGYVEPFTGQGIACALASARAVAPLALRGIESWSPLLEREWSARHRELFDRRLWVCRALAQAARRPVVARAVLALVARLPWLAGFLIDRVSAPPHIAEATGSCP